MTVNDLIEELSRLPQDNKVFFLHPATHMPLEVERVTDGFEVGKGHSVILQPKKL